MEYIGTYLSASIVSDIFMYIGWYDLHLHVEQGETNPGDNYFWGDIMNTYFTISAPWRGSYYSLFINLMLKRFYLIPPRDDKYTVDYEERIDFNDDREAVKFDIHHRDSTMLGFQMSRYSERLRDDFEVMIFAVKKNGIVLCSVSERLRDDDTMVALAVDQTMDPYYDANVGFYLPLMCASDRLSNDVYIVQLAFIHNVEINKKFASRRAIRMASTENEILAAQARYNPFGMVKDDYQWALKEIISRPDILQWLSFELRCDETIVRTAVSISGIVLKYACPFLKGDVDIALLAMQNSHDKYNDILETVDMDLFDNEIFAFEAVQLYPNTLKMLSRRLKGNKNIVAEAVIREGSLLQDSLLNYDREIVLLAV